MVAALIFAGGAGVRMKSGDIPKQFLEVEGKPIIIRTMEYFSEHSMVDSIVVVCLEAWIGELKLAIEKYRLKKVTGIIPGGKTGYQSIHKGLMRIAETAANEDIVLICDGVRPILSEQLITSCILETRTYGTAVPVTSSIDSVLYSEDGVHCGKNYERRKIYITQAPQGYVMKRIMDAHKKAQEQQMEAISSADLLIELGEEIHIFPGLRENIKVTTPEDLNSIRATQYYEHFKNFSREELKYLQ